MTTGIGTLGYAQDTEKGLLVSAAVIGCDAQTASDPASRVADLLTALSTRPSSPGHRRH